MICPACRKEMADGTRFCPSCGTSMEQGANYSGGTNANSANYVNGNNSPAQSGDFRGVREQYANEVINTPNQPVSQPPASAFGEKKSKTWIWITAIITVVALAALAVCYFAFWKDGGDEPVSNNSVSDNNSKGNKHDDKDKAITDKKGKEVDEKEDDGKSDGDNDGGLEPDDPLKVATNAEFYPFEYIDGGEMCGAEIEMAEAIGEELGMGVFIENVGFDFVFEEVANGKCDVGISGITPTNERKRQFEFSDAYYKVMLVAVVAQDSDIESIYDLEGKTISYENGSISEYVVADNYECSGYDSSTDAFIAVAEGYADACVVDYSTAEDLCLLYDEMLILDEAFYEAEYAIAIQKGNDELTEKINDAIRKLKKDGTLKEIFEKYDLPYEE